MMTHADAVAMLTAPGQFFEMQSTNVNGLWLRTYRNAPENLRTVFESMPDSDSDALVYLEERYTFVEFKVLVKKVVAALAASGIGKGHRVALAMRNLPEYVCLFWACQQLGAISVGLNAWWSRAELGYALKDCRPDILFVDRERYERVVSESGQASLQTIVVAGKGQAPLNNALGWDQFLLRASGHPGEIQLEPDDPATMLYTSGTTGEPRAALATHRNHTSNLMNALFFGALSQAMAGVLANPGKSSPAGTSLATLIAFPLFHISGIYQLYISAATNAKLVLMFKWNADEAARLIERERVTALALAPVMLRQLVDSAQFKGADHTSVRAFATGAAPVPPELAKTAGAAFGPGVAATIGYGLTETTSGVSANTGHTYLEHPDSVGAPFPVIEVRVVDSDGREVAAGEPGELWVRGPNVIAGYWGQANASHAAFPGDGWFRTGDVVRMDADRFIYIVDRIKDMIIRGGENIYCVEVESILSQHPSIDDVAVVGLPHPTMGEQVIAVVVARPGSALDAAAVIEYANHHMAHFKVPAQVLFRTMPFERTPAGKLSKVRIRESVAEELTRLRAD